MADLNVALILRLVDKATGPAKAVIDRVNRMSGGAFARSAGLVNRGAREMGGGLADAARHARGGVAAIAAYNGALIAAGAAFIRPAAEMERFDVQLENLEGSSDGAKKAMAWIKDFATRTPLELNDTVAAYAKLKAFGVDPMNGSLQAMVDTMAATGGGAEQLDGLVLALGQAWTKGKLQGEEALQMLERGVPVWDLLGQKLGKTGAELQDMASKGKLGREEITLLIDALAERNAGASEKMSKTWGGIISNLSDHWTRFQTMVMDAGVFDWLKGRLQQLLDFLNAAAADGRLQRWAETMSASIIAALERTWQFGAALYEVWQQVWPALQQAAEWAGGWQNLMIGLIALPFARNILGIVMAFARLGRGMLLVTRAGAALSRGLLLLGSRSFAGIARTAVQLGASALPLAARGFTMLGRAALVAGRAAVLNPVGLAITAIAGGVYVIYQNWDNIVGYFRDKVQRIRDAFDGGLINGVFAILKEMNPFTLILDGAEGLFNYVTGWNWDADVIAPIRDAFLSLDLVQVGIKMIQDILAGLGQKLEELLAWFRALPGRIIAAIGSIDLGSIITWPQPPEWLSRWWNGDFPQDAGAAKAGALAADQRRGASLGYGVQATPVAGARALGGPVRAGRAYRWQEEGEELFVPRVDGTVISNRQLRQATSGRARSAPSVSFGDINVYGREGQSPDDIARAVRRELTRLARTSRTLLHDGGAYAV